MATLRSVLRPLGAFVWGVLLLPVALALLLCSLVSKILWLRLGAWATSLFGWGMCRIFGIRTTVEGPVPPKGSVIVSNHLGYADIFVLGAAYRSTFVAKSELGRWPLFGLLIRGSGTLLIDRRRSRDTKRVGDILERLLAKGLTITLFPEGTSWNGREILPFRPPLLATPVALQTPCVPLAITYRTPGADPALGGPSETVCWWGDMPFLPHFRKFISLPRIEARLRFGDPVTGIQDRKLLAAELHRRVATMFEPVTA